MHQIRWSEFTSATDAVPKNLSGTWAQLSDRLTKAVSPLPEQKRSMPAFSGATFLGGARRSTAGVELIHLICLDYDNAQTEVIPGEWHDQGKRRPKTKKVPIESPTMPEKLVEGLTAKGLTFRAYTTWSRTEDWMKFRVVIPFLAPVTPGVWVNVASWVIQELELPQDGLDIPVMLDVARMNFYPGSPNGETAFWTHDGDFLRIPEGAFDHRPLPEAQPVTRERSQGPSVRDPSRWGINLKTLQLSELLTTLGCAMGPSRQTAAGALKRRCTCPWGSEHSNGPDGDDAVIFEGAGEFPSFACAHSQHQEMGLDDILELAASRGIALSEYAETYVEGVDEWARRLEQSSSPYAILQEIAPEILRMDPLSRDRALDLLARAAGTKRKIVLEAVNRALPDHEKDIEDFALAMVDETLARWYAGGDHLVQNLDKTWWHYVGTHWKPIANENVLKQRILDTLQENKAALPKGRDLRSLVDSAFSLLQARRASTEDVLGLETQRPRVINCANGEVWIGDDGSTVLKPHRAASRLTYVLDVIFDPEAKAPLFEGALRELFRGAKDPEGMQRHLMEFAGYALQPRRDHKTWWIFQGTGNNGKTKFIQTLQILMSRESVMSASVASLDKDQFTRASLAGKLLFVDDDVASGTVLPDGILKSLSEDKLLTARHLYRTSFSFMATVLPVLLCNNWPSLKDLSQGTQERVQVIPFNRRFIPGEIPNPYPQIHAHEMPGVLNMAIEGFRRLQARGRFDPPSDCALAKAKFLQAANPLALWLEDACEQVETSTISSQQAYNSYRNWATGEGHQHLLTKSSFERDIESLGCKVVRDQHLKARVIQGLKIIDVKETF